MIRALNDIARKRGQSLAQMAISWVLRDQGDRTLTSALLGASSVEQLEHNLGTLDNLAFSAEELGAIDDVAHDAGINRWAGATASRVRGN